MLPNAAEIRYFLEIASTLNISRAAERLGITQPYSPEGPVFEDKVCLVYRPDAQRSLAFKTVVKAIERAFRAEKKNLPDTGVRA